ncbi:hypothetical protein FNB79_11155 [Formosa sediminum]|uniref:DUF4831 family protein n=1 Tax=Formosa sediminum TaxID=2594004 RepID=A0A516GSK4_9FLAO|nr:hypothetical protein [Formosa sediminum]QDO94499.1 hypothetical protein FNB79_11155 [Formosa sediminum]
MKNLQLYFVLLLVILSSCSRKTYTALYQDNHLDSSKVTSYFLPKHVLKLEIVYTINEPRVVYKGIDQALTSSPTKVTIEDPILITKHIVADQSQAYILSGKQVADKYFKTEQNYEAKDVDTITVFPIDKDTHTAASSVSLTDSSREEDAYAAVLEMLNNISKIQTKQDAVFTLDLVSFYKMQFTQINEDYKPYVKKNKVKYTVIVDPLIQNHEDYTIYPSHIFSDAMVLMDTVTIVFPKVKAIKANVFNAQDVVEGVAYRSLDTKPIHVKMNTDHLQTTASSYHQFETIKLISASDLKTKKNQDVILFDTHIAPLEFQEVLFNLHDTVEDLNFNKPQSITESQISIKKAYKEKLQKIDLLIKKLEERKAAL